MYYRCISVSQVTPVWIIIVELIDYSNIFRDDMVNWGDCSCIFSGLYVYLVNSINLMYETISSRRQRQLVIERNRIIHSGLSLIIDTKFLVVIAWCYSTSMHYFAMIRKPTNTIRKHALVLYVWRRDLIYITVAPHATFVCSFNKKIRWFDGVYFSALS